MGSTHLHGLGCLASDCAAVTPGAMVLKTHGARITRAQNGLRDLRGRNWNLVSGVGNLAVAEWEAQVAASCRPVEKCGYRLLFGVVNLEYHAQLSDLQEVDHAPCQVAQLDLAAGRLG